MKRLAAAIALLAPMPAGAGTPADYAVLFPLDTPGDEPAWRIELTPDVYAQIHDAALRDLEVFNAAGQPVPSALLPASPATSRPRETALPLFRIPATPAGAGDDLRLVIERDAAGRLRRMDADAQGSGPVAQREWLVDAAAADCAIERIRIDWSAPATGVVATFSLATGEDLLHWRPIGSSRIVALDQDGTRIERRELPTSATTAPYLRLRRDDSGADLHRMRLTATCAAPGAGPARAWLEAEGVRAIDGRQFDYRLPAPVPVDTVQVELAGTNTLAALHVSLLDARGGVVRKMPVTAYRLDVAGDVLHNEAVAFPTTARTQHLRIEASTPLVSAPRVTAGHVADRLVFLAEGDGPFRLGVGSARVQRPEYPVATALAMLRARRGATWEPPSAGIGSMQVGAGDAALTARHDRPWRLWLLWGVLGSGALLVIVLVLRLLRERDAG